jgi:hypothetical protein
VRSGLRSASPSTSSAANVASAPELRSPVVALSPGGLRRKIEVLMLPDDVDVILQLDGLAERERHRRAAPPPLRVR